MSPLLGQCNFLTWNLVGFFHEATGKHQNLVLLEEADEPEDISPVLSSYLPEIIGSGELLEVLSRDDLEILDQTQYPDHLLRLLSAEPVEELLNGAVPSKGPVEVDLAHSFRLTQT